MKRLLLIAAILVVLTNAAVFARVAYNRSGEAKVITLTERELSLPYNFYRQKKENSGLSLEIQWQITEQELDREYYSSNRSYTVSPEVLEGLGFTAPEYCDGIKKELGGQDKSRKAWVLLQYDGSAHANEVAKRERYLAKRRFEIGDVKAEPEQKELERIAEQLEYVKHYQSRLYVANVALEKETLIESAAADPSSLLLAAEISNGSHCSNKKPVLSVYVSELLPSSINVPRRFHGFFEGLPEGDKSNGNRLPRYEVEVAVGRLNEPWLVGVEGVIATR